MDSIADGLSNKSLNNPIANRTSKGRKPSVQEVDAMADEVVYTFDTPGYRRWYCQLCYKLGINRVRELMLRATRDGVNNPGRLFSSLAKLEERQHDARDRQSRV